MRRRTLLVSVAILAIAAGCMSEPAHPLIGKTSPDLTLQPLSGKSAVHLKDLRGKVVVLDFWQTWCGPCLALMPHMSELQEKYRDRGLLIFGVTNETRTDVRRLLDRRDKVSYEIMFDTDDAAWRAYSISPIPATAVIGRDGVVRWFDTGMNEEVGYEDLDRAIESAVAER